jgi:indole-3-glycerol phosphate synthase
MSDFLEQVIEERRAYVAQARHRLSFQELEARPRRSGRVDYLHQALRGHTGRIAVIAEVKRRSPAGGLLARDIDPGAQARRYVAAGATAISVLTEPRHWSGSLDDLAAVRAAVDVPVLAKDVIVDPYQVYEIRAAGADAVLLIAEAFPEHGPLRELVTLVERLGMTALVEAHEVVAFGRAVSCGARVVGVNARNLRRPSEIDVGRVRQLHTFVRRDQTLVAESGIGSVDDARLLPARVDAVLVGTALMRADDPAPLIQGIASIRRTVAV